MKHIFLLPLLFGLGVLFLGNTATQSYETTSTLQVTVEAGESADGYVYVILWKDDDGFPGEVTEAWRNQKTKAREGSVTLTFTDLPQGKYAITAFHDADNDGEVDRNWVGLPTESVGAYNHNSWGRPSFSKATLHLNQPQHRIKISYLN